ncbi:cyclin-like protein, partial [Ostreococcus tauri]
MASPRVTRRAAAHARTKSNVSNIPLIDLTNRGGAASASERKAKDGAARGKSEVAAKRRRDDDLGTSASRKSEKQGKKTKRDDLKCAETLARGRAVPNVERGMVTATSLDYPFSAKGGRRAMELVKENVLSPYVDDGRYFNAAVRQQLVDWMTAQHNSMTLEDETLHLAIVYVDTFLMHRVPDNFLMRHGSGSEPVEAKPLRALDAGRVLHAMDSQHPLCNKLKRLGITCIFVAAKVTEVTTPSANEFARHAQVSSFTREQLLLAERALLRELNYALIRPTAFSFVEAYIESVLRSTNSLKRFPDRIDFANCPFADYGEVSTCFKETAFYLVELTMYGHEGLKFAPSLIAAAAVAAALDRLKITWD